MNPKVTDIALQGLWKDNPALVQLLGLCPLLAVSSSVVNALGLGLATIMVLAGSNLCVSLVRRRVSDAVRLPVFVLIIAAFVTCAELLMQAFAFELHQTLGIFIPLIVTNCAILARAEAFAARHAPLPALFDGLMMGLGFALVLLVLGALRELVGTGRLFADMGLLLPFADDWTLTVVEDYRGFLLAILPPGAFLFLGLLLALRNVVDARLQARRKPVATVEAGARRVRITG